MAVVTNVEVDHHATYRGQARRRGARSPSGSPPVATTIAWVEAPLPAADVRYGIEDGRPARRRASCWTRRASRFEVDGVRRRAARCPGAHNVLNALAALAACRAAGVPIAEAAPALATFRGAKRRFEWRGLTDRGAAVYRRLRAPPDRGRGDARRRAHARARGAWSPASSRTSTRARSSCSASSAARWRSPTSSW